MIRGVHAQRVAFVDYEEAAKVFQLRGWAWLGVPGPFSTRWIHLNGTPARDCSLRVTEIHTVKQALACTIQLESREGVPGTPLIRGDLGLAPAPNGNRATRCVLSLQGSASRNLADSSGPSNADASRHLANEYVRSLLEQISGSLERVGTEIRVS